MSKGSRREFMKVSAALAGLGAATGCANAQQKGNADIADTKQSSPTQHAESLFDVEFTPQERAQMAETLENRIDVLRQLRGVEKPNTLAPSLVFDPRLPGQSYKTNPQPKLDLAPVPAGPKPGPRAIPFASAKQIGRWIASRVITSRLVTETYLSRIEALDPQLKAFITVTKERALAEADAMDAELRTGKRRGPLHGVPYALKDLFDAEGVPTTWGAAPYKDGPPASEDCTIVKKLKDSGAILLGKTTCGALAYGDIWFDGITRNPWNTSEGSSGSSAGSASAVAGGLCAFAIGTETLGSLVSPSERCGGAALRPTFGRVSRQGGMALCWSLDKAGPMARSVEDLAIIMAAINGGDAGDASSIDTNFSYSHGIDLSGLRLGIAGSPDDLADHERAAIDAAKSLGATTSAFTMPNLPAAPLVPQLLVEAAAAFEEMTLSGKDDELVWQDDDAWPNSFRAARFISAIDLIQIDRLRRRWMQDMHEAFENFDVVIGPSFSAGLLTPTNYTGHPCLVMRAGFREQETRPFFNTDKALDEKVAQVPGSISLWAPLFGEGPMLAFGRQLEAALGVADRTPELTL